MNLSENAMKKLARRVLDQASLGDLRVRIDGSTGGHRRFAGGQPTTGGEVEQLSIQVTASDGNKSATATGNATDTASLLALVQRAEAMAALAPENPEHMPPLGKTKFDTVDAVDPAAAKQTAAQRGDAIEKALATGNAAGVETAGFIEHELHARVVADRAGLLAFHDWTSLSMTTTCRTGKGGSARRAFTSHAAKGLDATAMTQQAAQWAKRSNEPTGFDPGTYTVVLAPEAVADLLDFFVGALGARSAMEGRSVFSKPDGQTKIGDALFASSVDVWSDPTHPQHPASPMSRDGVPQKRTEWVKGGRLLALSAGRFWADKAGIPVRPRPSSLHMAAGGSGDVEALVGQVDKGILVSRFWYNRMLSRRTLTVTGLTRDGTFLIEKGAIARPIKNFRYNDSPLTMLSKLVAAGTPVRTAGGRVTVVPPVIVDGFHFESVSDAV